MKNQMHKDQEQWGDNWINHSKEMQVGEIYERYVHYLHQYRTIGEPIPWVKIAIYAMIAWTREKYL
jgi:hypothetical protein